jgi:hypothetical protein
MHQKRSPPDDPVLPIGRKSECRNQIVDMGVKTQVAGPGLQYAEHANLPAQEARVVG